MAVRQEVGLGKSVEGKSTSGCQCQRGFLGEEVFGRMQAVQRGVAGVKIGLWGPCSILLRSSDFIL